MGADCAAVVLSEAPYLREEMSLLVDVGTNAEIVLGNRDRLLSASSPTGPAFEGAQISSGQRAAPGAIERVRINPETLEPRFKVIGCDLWSNDPSFESQLGAGAITGICGSGIIEVLAEMYLSCVINTDGVIDGGLINRSDRIVEDGRTGFLFVPGSFSQLAEKLNQSFRVNSRDYKALSLRAREFAEINFSADGHYKVLLELYREVLAD